MESLQTDREEALGGLQTTVSMHGEDPERFHQDMSGEQLP